MDQNGKMMTGWQDITGNTYYFYPQSGALAIDQFIEGKYVDEDGAGTDTDPAVGTGGPETNFAFRRIGGCERCFIRH